MLFRSTVEKVPVATCQITLSFENLIDPLQLAQAECCLEVREPVVQAGDDKGRLRVRHTTTVIPEFPRERGNLGITCHDRATLARGDQLAWVEGEASDISPDPSRPVVQFGAERTGSVFDHRDLVFGRQLKDSRVGGHEPKCMDDDDRLEILNATC